MDQPTVEEEKNILFQGMGVTCGDELRNSSFIILPTPEKYLGIFKILPDIQRSVVSGCIESDFLELTSTFVGSFLYIIGGRAPHDFVLSGRISWLDIQSSPKEWGSGKLPSPCADPVIGVYGDDLYILPGVWKYGYYHMDEDKYLTNQKGYIWNTRQNKFLRTDIDPPKVKTEKCQWRRIRACAALDGEGLLIAMDGEEENFFLYKENEWKICEFDDRLPKFIGETSFAASNGRLYILEVRGESPALLYIYDIKKGKLGMYEKPILEFAKDLWSMDEWDRVVRIVSVADDKLCFLWLGPVSYEDEKKWWPPVRTLHYLKVKFSINPNPSKSEIEVEDDKVFSTNIAELFYCLPCSESFSEEVNCNSPLYCPLDAGQDQEDIISPTEKGERVECAIQLAKISATQQFEINPGRDNEVEISQEEKQITEPQNISQNISKLTSQPQERSFEMSQEEKLTPEPQNISELTSQPEGGISEISQEEKQIREPQNISELTSQPQGRTFQEEVAAPVKGFDLPLSHIPHIPAPLELAAPVKGFKDFYSRMDVMEKIMHALQSQSSNIIGVHGMPGVGKTMLVKEVKRKAEQDQLFDAVVMVFVSRNAELKNIQVEIARGLGLDELPYGLRTQDVAERIKARLMKMKKVLIILDDIWGPGINLEELGIPLTNEPKTTEGSSSRGENAEYKILLTSRDSCVLSNLMGSLQNFSLHQLEFEEAWELLKQIVGDRAESDELHGTAIDIVRRCGGLPLAITTIAKALKNKKPNEWRDVLRKLRKPFSKNFGGIFANVYSAIAFSYSHLESEKLKETFLLCCLMGHRSSVRDLLNYGAGLGLFANTIQEARDEVLTLLRKLRASSLLIDDHNNDYFDMHDIVHDVAVSIARSDHHGLLLTGDHVPKEWSDMEAMKDFKWIWLQKANISELPDGFESPRLTFFCLVDNDPSMKIQADFFKGLERLKVLDLTEMHLASLPSSICLLKNLRTLCFSSCLLGDISVIGKLKNLEVLTVSICDIKELPREIGELTQLKLLDLTNCSKLKIIPQHVLARMYRLEELYLGNSFDGWEVEENENQRNASLAELKHLEKLTNLEVCIPDIRMIPKALSFENLKKFKIFIGRKWEDQHSSSGSSRMLKLHLNASINVISSVKRLLEKTEELHLRELAGVKNVVEEFNTEGFPDLKYLYVRNAPEVQHIAEGVSFNAFPRLEVLFLQNLINLEKIFQGRFRGTAFNNLRTITIEGCHRVKNLFSSSMARQLLRLQEISVTDCWNMEEIVDDEEQGGRNDIVEATELKFGEGLRSLRLQGLHNLSSLNKSCRHMPLFNEQVAFPNLEELQLCSINVNTIWHTSITSSHVGKLRTLIIEGCGNLEYLFPSSMVRDLVMLGQLKIRECEKMREVLIENVEENGDLIFPQLRILEIESLPKLQRFCHGNCIKFHCLSQLLISSCPVLKTFISSSSSFDTCTPLFDTKVTFPKLEQLKIEFLKSLDKIWDNQLDASSFRQLNYLRVFLCDKLLNIFPFSILERLQRLDKLEITSCYSLEEIVESQGLDAGQSQTQKFTPPTLMESGAKFVFPKLTQLDLYFLHKLKALCPQMHTAEWPSLKKLTVCECGQVQIFASELSSFPRTNGDDQLEVSFFWTSKATFPSLEELSLGRNDHMKEIWHGQHILGDYFPKLKVLKLTESRKELVVQPFLFQSPNLEKLVVHGTPFHEIFKCQGLGGVENPALALTQLSELRLSQLGWITCLWKKESNLESVFSNLKILEVLECRELKNLVPSFISFKNLTTLGVSACRELINLIEYSTAKSMVQLTRMSISKCHMLKEIVKCVHDVKDDIVFSQLKYLQLCDLPRLANFCSGGCSFEFGSLEEVIVMTCPNMQIFSHGECSTPKKLQKVKLTENGDVWFWEGNLNCTIQKMFREKVGYDGLENLTLSESHELIEIWNKKPQENLPFKRLKYLKVCNCSSLRYLLTTSMALGLMQLGDLRVASCAAMEQVIIGEGAEEMFPKLRHIFLEYCPNLKCFYEGTSGLEIPQLYEISVDNCPALAVFASSFSSDQKKEVTTNDTESEERTVIPTQPFFSDKVVLPSLKELQLCWMNVNVKWHTSITSFCFKKLNSLTIEGFDNLEFLFSSCVTRDLVMLGQLYIRKCKGMREIIFTENAEEKEKLIFPQLNYLLIEDLQNLVGFYLGNCFVEFPSLKYLEVLNCPEFEGFTIKYSESTSCIVDIQTLFNKQAAFPNLESLTITDLKNLEMIWHSKVNADALCKLKSLRVENCEKLSTVFPSTEATLPDLEWLTITHMKNLEMIWHNKVNADSLCKLKSLTVGNCEKLLTVFPSTEAAFPNLESLYITHLKNLEMIWHSKVYADSFHKLKSLTVENCEKLLTVFPSTEVVFPNLKDLQLCWMNFNIKWHTLITSLHVNTLRELIIQGFDNLEFLFSSCVARGLVMLKQLEIRECKRMREIIVTENAEEKGNLIFPQLCYLLIKDLQNLVGFYLGNYIVEFPSLKKLDVLNCPEFEGFTVKYSESTSCIADIQTLFNEQVTFPNLKELTIAHLKNLEIIWHSKLYADSFCRLKSLRVENCEKLLTVFPSTDKLGKILKSLEWLSIYQCGSLEGIFEIAEFNVKEIHAVIDTKLRALDIEYLPRLKHVWNKDPQGMLTFHNLESVNVSYCGSLKNLFPASIGKSLLQLRKLHLNWCQVEEIVTMGEEEAEAIVSFEFPQVTSLKLEVLPRLQCFYPGKHTTMWPMLKKFCFSHFNQVKRADGCGQLDFPVRLPLFSTEKIIPQLEALSLARHDLAMICEHKSKLDILFNIKVLQIQDYIDDELDVFPVGLLRRFRHLENLVVRFCNFKELFPSKGEVEEQEKHIEIETLSRIKKLKLDCLPYLRHIWSRDSPSVLKNLENLDIFKCDSLIILSNATSSFQNITTLSVRSCNGMINLVSVSTVQSLVQLESMTVDSCHMLAEIVGNEGDGMQDYMRITFSKLSSLTLKHLPRLESFCSKNFTFIFPCLEDVIVNQCPMLKIFSEGDIHTPMLQNVAFKEEHRYYAEVDGYGVHHDSRWEGDFNTTIQKKYMEEVGFAGSQILMLSDFPKLMETWQIKNPQERVDFRQLQVLEICNCSKLKYLLTYSMAMGLVQLLQLIVKNCGTMEQVIMGEGAENKMEFSHLCLINLESCLDLTSFYVGSHNLELPRLNDFIVRDCPKMVTCAVSTSLEEHDKEESQYLFSSKVETPNLEFLSLSSNNIQRILDNSIPKISSYVQNLRKLCVEGCGNLKNPLTSSMVKSFEQLSWLEIRDCHMMEEIIRVEESMDEERMLKIFFPNLEFLLLQDLPKLTRFCSGNYLELPCLWKLKISKCPVLKTFISSFISGDMVASSENVKNTCTLSLFDTKVAFPKLERLIIEHVKSLNKIWNGQLEVDSFCQLTLVSVVSCEKLMNIFPFSMVERLQRLDKLQIWKCDSLEEILESQEPGVSQSQAQKATLLPLLETVTCLEDDVKDEIVFSKLKYLQLCGLPRLSSFCSVKCKFEFPFLDEVILMDCPSMRTFSMDEIRTPKLQKVKLTGDEDDGLGDDNLNSTIQLHFMQKVHLL